MLGLYPLSATPISADPDILSSSGLDVGINVVLCVGRDQSFDLGTASEFALDLDVQRADSIDLAVQRSVAIDLNVQRTKEISLG